MSTAPTAVKAKDDDIEREILNDPEIQKALAELDDPEDREDLIEALVIQKRIEEGKEHTIPWEEVQRKLGL
jgi:hypothetical protein